MPFRMPLERNRSRFGARLAIGSLLLGLLCLCAPAVFAQGSPFVSGGITVFGPTGRPLAGATVTICAAGAAGIPCSPTITVYSDAALTVPAANPQTSDGLGNVFVYLAPGNYTYTVTGFGVTGKSFTATSACIPTAAACLASGIGNPATPGNTVQKSNANATAFAASGLTDDGTTLTVDRDMRAKGPNPYADATRSGVRAVVTVPSTTASCTLGSPVVTLTAGSTFQNGDGVVAFGCGPTNTMATPGAPTVTPSTSAGMTGSGETVPVTGGATTYNYKIAACDSGQGCTAASAAGSTTTGQASLGSQSVSITSITRSGNTMTFTTAVHGLVVGAYVYVSGNADTTFNGLFKTVTVTDNTHFTATSGMKTDNGATASAAGTLGTVKWFNTNHVTWSDVTGSSQFYVYSDRAVSGTFALVCVAKIIDRQQTNSEGSFYCDDFGATMMATPASAVQAYIPSTAPASATNDSLVTTISSGGGSTSVTLAANASQTASAQTFTFDDGVTLATAVTAAAGKPVYVPFDPAGGTYPIFSRQNLGNVSLVGVLDLRETLILGPAGQWRGDVYPRTTDLPQFAFKSLPATTCRAVPCVYFPGGSSVTPYIANMKITGISAPADQQVLLQLDSTGTTGGTLSWVYLQPTTATDYMNLALLMRGDTASGGNSSQMHFDHVNLTTAQHQTTLGDQMTPAFYCVACGRLDIQDIAISGRGMLVRPVPAAMNVQIRSGYMQGGATPFLTVAGGTLSGSTGVHIQFISETVLDTTSMALLANYASTGGLSLYADLRGAQLGVPTGTSMPQVTGDLIPALLGTSISGQNSFSSFLPSATNGNQVPPFPDFTDETVQVRGVGKYISILPTPAAPTCAVLAGGSTPVQTGTEAVSWVDAFGFEGAVGPTCSFTTTTGNQTVQVTPPAMPASKGIVGYTVYRNGVKTGPSSGNCPTTAVGTAFNDTLGFANPCGTGLPLNPGGGIFSVNSTGDSAPEIRLPDPAGSTFYAKQVAGALTANRTHIWPDTPGTVMVTGGVVDLTGAGAASVQTALNGLVAGKTYLIPCGTYTGPTTIPSNVALVGMGSPTTNLLASLWGSTPGGLTPAASCVTFNYTADLNLSQLQNVVLKGITLDFQSNAAGLILTSTSFSNFEDVIVNNCGGPAKDCLLLTTTGTGAGQNTAQNVFTRFRIRAFDGLTATSIRAGVHFQGNTANSTFVTLNRFYDLNVGSGGTLVVAVDFEVNCDTNFIYGYIVNSAVAGTIGLQFNNAAPTVDKDAGSNIILGYSAAAGVASPFMRFGQSSGNYIVAQGNGVAPTIVGGTPDFTVYWTGATTNSPRIFTNGTGFQSDLWTYKNADFASAVAVQSSTASSTRSANFLLRDNQATPQNITLRKDGANLLILDTANNAMTVPAGADTLVARATADTLTNKTIDCTLNTLAKNPCVVGVSNLTAQQANVPATTLTTPGANGYYRASCYVVLTQAATTSSTLPQCNLSWTDGDTSTSESGPLTSTTTANVVGTVGNELAGIASGVFVKAGVAVQFSTSLYASVGATPMQYAIHVRLEGPF